MNEKDYKRGWRAVSNTMINAGAAWILHAFFGLSITESAVLILLVIVSLALGGWET